MIPALLIAVATLIGAAALIASDEIAWGILVLIAGLGMAGVVLLVSEAVALARTVWDWVQLIRSNPERVHVVAVEPPKGFLIRNEATVTLDVEDEGQRRTMEQGIPIPRLQALIWRLSGKVPTPIGRLTDKRDLNARVWGRAAEADQPPGA